MVKIKIARKSDAKYIALLGRITFNETFGHLFKDKNELLEYHHQTFSVEKIKNGIKKSDNIFWMAYENKLPVGYAKLKQNSESEFVQSEKVCQLQKIYVLKDFLSMKIGFELQNRLIDKAQENKFEVIWLSVLESNTRAISFYRKNGFKEIGKHDFQIGKAHFKFNVMSKKL